MSKVELQIYGLSKKDRLAKDAQQNFRTQGKTWTGWKDSELTKVVNGYGTFIVKGRQGGITVFHQQRKEVSFVAADIRTASATPVEKDGIKLGYDPDNNMLLFMLK